MVPPDTFPLSSPSHLCHSADPFPTQQPMNITWVSNLPTGRETGTYLTLDLGGTNLRVCLITLKGTGGKTTPEKAADVTQENYTLPKKTKTGTAEELWTFVTQTLQEFVDKYNLQAEGEEGGPGKLPLGFTFSYPATQDRIDHGLLQTWTKGWDVKGVEGQDVAEMLRQAIQKRVGLGLSLCLPVCVIVSSAGSFYGSAMLTLGSRVEPPDRARGTHQRHHRRAHRLGI